MYAKGDYIHQITNGLCRIEDITTLEMDGIDQNRLYYRLCPLESLESTVYIPVEKAEGTTRYAMTGEEAKALITDIPSIETLWIPEERTRERLYKEALLSMDCRSWVKIIKTLYLRKLDRHARGQKMTSRDEQYLRKAEDRLYGELALALNKKKEDMESYITEQIRRKAADGAKSAPCC